MNQIIYGLISDNGSGDFHTDWYRTLTEVDYLLRESNGYENYKHHWGNNGAIVEILSFPIEVDLEQCGFTFTEVEVAAWGRG